MSHIGRLFRKIGTPHQTPIENFTTEALAIAIEHDDAPMRRALAKISWPITNQLDVTHLARVEARTQQCLFARDSLRQGYLDLVLELSFASGARTTAWVEVKVDSPENGVQLDVYADHARGMATRPVIFTLSKSEVRNSLRHPQGFAIGWLSWRDLADAIEAGPCNERWTDFLAFLREEQLAWPRMPSTVVNPDEYMSVLFAVNNRIRDKWPTYGIAWAGSNSAKLAATAHAEYEKNHRLVVTGGPLTYGLIPAGAAWEWSVTVGSTNHQRVRLDPEELVREADLNGLSTRWKRLGTRHAALRASIPLAECSAYEDATIWFDEALRELDEKRILVPFFRVVDRKRQRL